MKNSPTQTQFWKRMRELLGSESETEAFFGALEKLSGAGGAKGLRRNRLKNPGWELMEARGFRLGSVVPWEPEGRFVDLSSVPQIGREPLLGAGLVYIQEPGAMEAVSILDPQSGDFVLDLCAAPGAKSTQIGERLEGRGWLVANDPVRPRAERLDLLLARHGVANASVYSIDAESLAERFPQAFDRILVDAPCSGESLLAKRIDFRTDVRDVDVRGCARRQFTLLNHAAEMLRPGGVLVYSTCTYSREENEDIREAFLANQPEFSLSSESRRFPHRDQVAGGYVARFERQGTGPRRAPPLKAWQESSGLLRHSLWRWDQSFDVYAAQMAASLPQDLPFAGEAPRLETLGTDLSLDDAQASAYLGGAALSLDLPAKGLVRFLWRGWPLGPGRAVEGRINNLLPKLLRGL